MASAPSKEREQREERQEHAANMDATHREAYEYWGYLLKPDKCGTELLDRLLKGIAQVIVSCGACLAHAAIDDHGTDGATRARSSSPANRPISRLHRLPLGIAL